MLKVLHNFKTFRVQEKVGSYLSSLHNAVQSHDPYHIEYNEKSQIATRYEPVKYIIHTFTEHKRKVVQGAPPLPQRNINILYIILKGILWRFKFNLNFLIWRLYEQFSRNYSPISPLWVSEKISNF